MRICQARYWRRIGGEADNRTISLKASDFGRGDPFLADSHAHVSDSLVARRDGVTAEHAIVEKARAAEGHKK